MTIKRVRVALKNVVLSYSNIFTPKEFNGGDMKYSANFLIDKSDKKNLDNLNKIIEAIKKETWGDNGGKPIKINEDMMFLRDGDEKTWKGYSDKFYVVAKNRFETVIQDIDGSNLRLLDGGNIPGDKPQDGDIVNAIIDVWPNSANGKKQIGAYLTAVQFVKKGDRFVKSESNLFADFEDEDFVSKPNYNQAEADEANELFGN